MEHTGTVEKALEILQHLHRAGSARGVSEIGRSLGLPRSTTHRLLQALGRCRLVEREGAGRYRNGIGLVALGRGVLERESLVTLARPLLEETADLLHETSFLAAARGGRIFVLDKQEGGGLLRVAPGVGDEVPAHATGVGKLYLAFAPDEVAVAAASIAAPGARAALRSEVERVRLRGWARNRDEWVDGLAGVAAPIFAARDLVAVLAAAGPSSRVRPEDEPRFAEQLLAAAGRISEQLGRDRAGA